MREVTQFKTCEECKGPCQLLNSNTRPLSSEWFCEKCHRSYPVYEAEPESPNRPQVEP